MFPHGKMPAFRSTSGFSLVEGAAIARYCEYENQIGRSIPQLMSIQSLPLHQNLDSFPNLLKIRPLSISGVIS